MTRYGLCFVILALSTAAPGAAQDNGLLSVLRGDLIDWTNAAHGDFSIRTADSSVQRCRFDEQTYLEREKQKVAAARINTGQQVEVIVDRNPGGLACYARAVRVTREDDGRAAAMLRLQALRTTRSPMLDSIFPRGNLTFAAVVLSIGNETMLVRTRNEGQKAIHLRADTKFLDEGRAANSAALQPNMRVFIRAGKNLDNEIEAYQVVWGEILTPTP